MIEFLDSKKNALWLLFVISALVRFTALSTPNEVVFDEVHYGKFVSSYLGAKDHYFDVHPPLTKLPIVLLLWTLGYKGDQSFDHIGVHYEKVSAFAIRFMPALAGALCPVVGFLLLLQLGTSVPCAFLGGLALALDNAAVLQSRLLCLYPFLIFFQLLSVFLFLKAHEHVARQKYTYLALTGIALGFSVGTQFTGLAVVGLLGLYTFVTILKEKRLQCMYDYLASAVIGTALYLAGFYLHFSILTAPGQGDLFYKRTGHFWTDLIAMQKVMFSSSANLFTSHPDSSVWYTWPFMMKPIYYWQGKNAAIYFLGNPYMWIVVSLLIPYAVFSWLTRGKIRRAYRNRLWVLMLLFAIAFLPLTIMKRVLFLYHYLVPISFGTLFVVAWADIKGWLQNPWQYYFIIGILVACFLWISPVTYGIRMPNLYWDTLPWKLFH